MSYINNTSYVNNMSYINDMSDMSIYVGYMSYMSIFMNRLKSLVFLFLQNLEFFC